jgi:hypothetical protein
VKIKKPPLPQVQGTVHKARSLPDDLVRFSFRHFQQTDKFCLPDAGDKPHYVPTLLDRLRDVSGMRISEFRQAAHALRSHPHQWDKTTEKDGYAHLNEQLRDCEPWQFALSQQANGRVHGILIDDVFYVVWLDPEHRLYA